MREKNKMKTLLSLLVALAFILPAASAFGTTTNVNPIGKADASDEQASMKSINDGENTPETQGLLVTPMVTILGVNLLPNMGTGNYDINVTLAKSPGAPDCCDVKLFLDVFKLDPLPITEMYCTDFEDMADVMNNWDSVNIDTGPIVPGSGIDTFTISYRRANSGTFSFKNTQFDDKYMGNQQDWLETKIINTDGHTSGIYDQITVTYWQWMQGELVDGGGAGDIPEDYGQIQYSTDHLNWYTVPTWQWIDEPAEIGLYTPQVYTNTDGWEEVTGVFDGMNGVPEFWLRFYWISGPTIQNEGWYVDDVCVYGTYSPDPDFLFQTHSLGPITVCNPPLPGTVVYTFPTTWQAEEGTYHFEMWMLDDTLPPGSCMVEYPQAFKYMFDVEIGNFIDLEVLTNSFIGGPAFDMGDDLIVSTSVTNHGTVDAINVPVTFEVKQQVKTINLMDFVEGVDYPLDFDPYADTGIYRGINFGAPDRIGEWHITDFDSVSPTHAWMCADPATDHYPAGLSDDFSLNFPELGINLENYQDAVKFDITAKVNFKLATTDRLYLGVWIANTFISLGGTGTAIRNFISGIDMDTNGWVDISVDQIFQYSYGVTMMQRLEDMAFYGYGDWADVKGVFFMVDDATRTGSDGLATGPWSGVLLDNIKIESVVPGATVYTQIIYLDDVKAASPSGPAEIEVLTDKFQWLNMPTGDFIESKTVPADDSNPFKPVNFDNSLQQPFTVTTLITEIDETDVEHMDLYVPEAESHWHITTSGYNQYLWDGDEGTGVYGADWDEVCYLVSDDNSAHDESPISMDWSDTTQVTLNFDEYIDSQDGGFDFALIEVNPHVSEAGSQWYYHSRYLTGVVYDWTAQSITMEMDDFYNDYIGDYLDQVEGSLTFTDDMGVRLRFFSDSDYQYRGWLLDNIEIVYAGGDKYAENPCDNMDRFIADVPYPGDWWFEEPDPVGTGWTEGWTCLKRDVFAYYASMEIPQNVECALVWDASVTQTTSATLWFDYDYSLVLGEDRAYLEFSTNGGGLWITPVAFSGTAAGTYQYDMTSFVGGNVLIRWRIVTDDQSQYVPEWFHVENVLITGQVDLNPPVTTATLSGTMIHNYYSSAVIFKATATDDLSGVAATYYKLDGGSQQTYSAQVSIGTGTHYVEYWSVDNAGNIEVHKFTPTFVVDAGTGPTVTITGPTTGLYLFGNKLIDMAKTIIIGAFTIEATASDVGSGVASVEFFLDGTSIGSDISSPYSILCSAKHMGAGTIKAVARDYADNQGEASLDITYFKFV
jgi:hypothetical protein